MPTLTPMKKLVLGYVRGRMARREIKSNTAVRLRSILARFADIYGLRPVKQLSRRDIDRWLETRNTLAPASRRNEFQAVRQFVRWLIGEKHIKSDPMAHMKAPRVPRSVPRALGHDDVERLLAVLPDARACVVVGLMLHMGLRRGEVITLQLGDYDRQAQLIRVTGKGDHQRELPVPTTLQHCIDRYLSERGTVAGPLVLRLDGRGGISNARIGQMIRGWMEEAGVKQRPYDGRAAHSLRHTLASNVADIEPDLRTVQAILGHASLSSTQVYLRRAEMGKVRAVLEAVG
jgi:site-specific recombinase XerD